MLNLYILNVLLGLIMIYIDDLLLRRKNRKRKLIRDDLDNFCKNVSPRISELLSITCSYEIKDVLRSTPDFVFEIILSIFPFGGFVMVFSFVLYVLLFYNKEVKKIDYANKMVQNLKRENIHDYNYELRLILDEICSNIEKLKNNNHHAVVAEQGYDTLMELIEHSFVNRTLSQKSLGRIFQSAEELKALTNKLLATALEENKKNLDAVQASIDLSFDKFDQLMKSMCKDIDERKMIFSEIRN